MSPRTGSAVTGAGFICCTSEGPGDRGGAGRKASSVGLGSAGSPGLQTRRVCSPRLQFSDRRAGRFVPGCSFLPRRTAPLPLLPVPAAAWSPASRPPFPLCQLRPPGGARLRPVRAHTSRHTRACACVLTRASPSGAHVCALSSPPSCAPGPCARCVPSGGLPHQRTSVFPPAFPRVCSWNPGTLPLHLKTIVSS